MQQIGLSYLFYFIFLLNNFQSVSLDLCNYYSWKDKHGGLIMTKSEGLNLVARYLLKDLHTEANVFSGEKILGTL